MNRFAALFIPTALAMGCVVTTPVDVQFNWSFQAPNGGTSCVDADVQTVTITIDGITKQFVCNDFVSGAGQSGVINGILSGTQTYTVAGFSDQYDINGNYTGQVQSYGGTFTTDLLAGTLDVENISLTPLGTPSNSNIILLWTFNGSTCSQIGSPQVTIQIVDPVSGNVNMPVPCTANGVDGAKITNFAAGSYPFTLSANDGTNGYFASGTLYVNGYSDTAAHIDLGIDSTQAPPPNGPGTVNFEFTFGAGQAGCSAGGVSTVSYFLSDGTGAFVPGSSSSDPCNDPLPPVTITNLSAPGTYYLSARGLSGNTVSYQIVQYQFEVYPGASLTYSVNLPSVSGF